MPLSEGFRSNDLGFWCRFLSYVSQRDGSAILAASFMDLNIFLVHKGMVARASSGVLSAPQCAHASGGASAASGPQSSQGGVEWRASAQRDSPFPFACRHHQHAHQVRLFPFQPWIESPKPMVPSPLAFKFLSYPLGATLEPLNLNFQSRPRSPEPLHLASRQVQGARGFSSHSIGWPVWQGDRPTTCIS